MLTARIWLIAGALTISCAALTSAVSSADCCLGFPVSVVLRHWAPLTATLRPTVLTDVPEANYRATIRAYLKVGNHRIARLNNVTVDPVTTTPTQVTFNVPARAREAAARYGARTHHRHGTITFVISAIEKATGQSPEPPSWSQDAFVTLPRVRH